MIIYIFKLSCGIYAYIVRKASCMESNIVYIPRYIAVTMCIKSVFINIDSEVLYNF